MRQALQQSTQRADWMWAQGWPVEEIEKELAWEYHLQQALGVFDHLPHP